MKTIEIHVTSALLGAASLGLVLIPAGAVQVTSTQQAPNASPTASVIAAPITIDNPIQVRRIPRAKNMVRIDGGTPYIVPSARLLVLTGMGLKDPSANQWPEADTRVNGVSAFMACVTNRIQQFPSPGIVVSPGAMVEVITTSGLGPLEPSPPYSPLALDNDGGATR